MAHYILTIVVGIFFAILAQRAHWMLALSLLFIIQTVTLVVIAMVMYPTNWMTEETFKVEHQRYLGEVARIRGIQGRVISGHGGMGEVLIAPP